MSVAKLMEQIELESAAMWNGLNGFAEGASRHAFVQARYNNLDELHEQLTAEVGPEESIKMVAAVVMQNGSEK